MFPGEVRGHVGRGAPCGHECHTTVRESAGAQCRVLQMRQPPRGKTGSRGFEVTGFSPCTAKFCNHLLPFYTRAV